MTTITLGDAVQQSNAADAQVVDAAVALGESIAENAIDAANERADQAEEMAQRIAEGALETERGRRIDALENEVTQWRDAHNALVQLVQALSSRLSEMEQNLTAVATLEVASLMAPSQSTPATLTEPIAEALETTTEIAEVLPEAISQNENTPAAPEAPVRKVRRLI